VSARENNFEPMTAGMILDKAFRLYLENFALMVGLSAILNIPVLAFTLIFGGGQVNPDNTNVSALLVGLLPLLPLLLAMLLIVPLISGATTAAVSDVYLGNSVTVGHALSAAWSRAWSLLKNQFIISFIVGGAVIGAGIVLSLFAGFLVAVSVPRILVAAIVFVGIIPVLVLAIFLALSYMLVSPIIMIEGSKNDSQIRRRSWVLVKGNRLKIFLILLAITAIQLLVQLGIAGVMFVAFGIGTSSMVTQAMNGLISILLTPMSVISVTLLYYDFRIRKEGFDLEMLSHAIGGATPEA